MAPTTPVLIDRYAIPARRPHPRPTDRDVHARARAHQIAALERRATALAAERDATVRQLQANRVTEMQDIRDQLLLEIRDITAGVDVVQAERGGAVVFAGPTNTDVLCALLGTRNALARALHRLDEADTAGLDAITAITADVDDRIDRINRQIAAIDYGTKVGAA